MRAIVGDQGPGVGRERDFAPLPRAPADLRRGLEERELVGPGGELTVAAEVSELPQDRHQSVVGALVGEVVVVVVAQMRDRATAPVDLEPCGLQEQRMQRLDGRLTLRTVRAEAVDPRLRDGVETQDRLGGRQPVEEGLATAGAAA